MAKSKKTKKSERDRNHKKRKEPQMLERFLREIVTIVVGKYAEDIADLLNTKDYVNEFLIAKKLDITINQTRNILYKLSDEGLVSSIRKKDKKKGWYTYFWKIEILKALEFLKEIKSRKLEQIENQIVNRETQEFYVCERCNLEFTEEAALLRDFICAECGDVFTRKDNTKLIKALRKNAERFEDEISLIDREIEKEKEKLEKKKEKEQTKEKRVRLKKRRLAAKKRKAAMKKKKPKKKSAKKSAKKKAKKKAKAKGKKKKPKKKSAKKSAKKKAKKKSKVKKKKKTSKKKK